MVMKAVVFYLRLWPLTLLCGVALLWLVLVPRREEAQAAHVPNHLDQNYWNLYFEVTPGDGLRIYGPAKFQGNTVFFEAHLPWVRVYYNGAITDRTDHPGMANAVGGVGYVGFINGFELYQQVDFGSPPGCGTYRYIQRYRFYDDGTFKSMVEVYGSGYDFSHHYEPQLRTDFDVVGAGSDTFWHYRNGQWQKQTGEGKAVNDGMHSSGGYEWTAADAGQVAGWKIKPFNPQSAGMWGLRYHAGEINDEDASDGVSPGEWNNGESIDTVDLVSWRTSRTPATGEHPGCTYQDPPYLTGFVAEQM